MQITIFNIQNRNSLQWSLFQLNLLKLLYRTQMGNNNCFSKAQTRKEQPHNVKYEQNHINSSQLLSERQKKYINRKYQIVCQSINKPMNLELFKRYFSYLRYSQSTYKKLFDRFRGKTETMTYKHFLNSTAYYATLSNHQINDYIYTTYIIQINNSAYQQQSHMFLKQQQVNGVKRSSVSLGQLMTKRSISKQRMFKDIEKYIDPQKFRQQFIETGIQQEQHSIYVQLRIFLKLTKQDTKFKQGHQVALISTSWLDKIMKYLEYKYQPVETQTVIYYPEQINNRRLLGEFQWELEKNIAQNVDYRLLNKDMYKRIWAIYGGGPQIYRNIISGSPKLYDAYIKFYKYQNYRFVELYLEKNKIQELSFQYESQFPQKFNKTVVNKYNPRHSLIQIYNYLNTTEYVYYTKKFGKKWKQLDINSKDNIGSIFRNTSIIIAIPNQQQTQFISQYIAKKQYIPLPGDIFRQKKANIENYKNYYIINVNDVEVKYLFKAGDDFNVVVQKRLNFEKNFDKVDEEESSVKNSFVLSKFPQKIVREGIINLGNTCYLSSSLQMLIHTRTKKLLNNQYSVLNPEKSQSKKTQTTLIHQLNKIVKTIQQQKQKFDPSEFVSYIYKKFPDFEQGQQHDAQQFLAQLLDKLKQQNHQEIIENYENLIVRRFSCKTCKNQWTKQQKELILSLSVEDFKKQNCLIDFYNGKQFQKIRFDISQDSKVKQWVAKFFKASNNFGSNIHFAESKPTQIKNISINGAEYYKNLNINEYSSIVAYLLEEYNFKESVNFEYYIYNQNGIQYLARGLTKQPQNKIKVMIKDANGFRKDLLSENQLQEYPRIDKNKKKLSEILIANFLNNQDSINPPEFLQIESELPYKVIRLAMKKRFPRDNQYQMKIVKYNNVKICYFCNNNIFNKIIEQQCRCFDKKQSKYPIEWLEGEVKYIIVWKKKQFYDNTHKRLPDLAYEITNKTNLEQSLKTFNEKLVLQIDCQFCKKQKNVEITTELYPAKILIFHLKRRVFKEGIYYKITTQFAIQKDIKIINFNYKLKGVILHRGDQNSGHYIAVADEIKYNDSKVYEFSYDKIQPFEVFMLFYQRIN